MKKMNIVFGLIVLTSSLGAFASSFTPEYSCFNRVQLADGPMVSIHHDENGNRILSSKTRGAAHTLELTLTRSEAGITYLSGEGVQVRLFGGALPGATVTFTSIGLTYKCKLIQE